MTQNDKTINYHANTSCAVLKTRLWLQPLMKEMNDLQPKEFDMYAVQRLAYERMVLRASPTFEYLNWNPNSLALVGSTFCPSKTCQKLTKLLQWCIEYKKMRMFVRILTTVAPSPRTALRAKSGTGSHEGRPRTAPNWLHISANLTGFGAVPFITPDI